MTHQHLRDHNCYQNCAVYSPDNELMFRCSYKRARWYLKRDLADLISKIPFVIQLTFQPQGKGHAGNAYYLSPKKNRCVVCGSGDQLTKHHVVPQCYRKSFSEEIKSHTSYDVFLVCANHHEEYEAHAWKFKLALGVEYDVPMAQPKEAAPDPLEKALLVGCRAACALARHGDQMPETRKQELRASLVTLGVDGEPIEDTIQRLVQILEDRYHPKRKGLNIEVNFGAAVVEHVDDIQEFIRRWRRHFVETMNPEFLPEHWDIEKDWRGY